MTSHGRCECEGLTRVENVREKERSHSSTLVAAKPVTLSHLPTASLYLTDANCLQYWPIRVFERLLIAAMRGMLMITHTTKVKTPCIVIFDVQREPFTPWQDCFSS